ncbi:hypothetical protein CPB83DRAFT_844518 [Crepidotus variabilis]|uniref:Uncharacterized protein n=1 Tax=Crepidotus variabilis TaxID=179855 RepID=A0A9P6JVA8_9AGAR|nr:hypothetical protein CPB83DRAFT_844518 [Crepidotus variabilis]
MSGSCVYGVKYDGTEMRSFGFRGLSWWSRTGILGASMVTGSWLGVMYKSFFATGLGRSQLFTSCSLHTHHK